MRFYVAGRVPAVPPGGVHEQPKGVVLLAGARAPGVIDLVRRLRLAEAYRTINATPRNAEPSHTDAAAGWLLAYDQSDVDRLERMLGRSLEAWRSKPQPMSRGEIVS